MPVQPEANPDTTHFPRPATRPAPDQPRHSFSEDFRRFFVRGLKALLPTLITLWLLFWVWNFLWDNIGQHIIWAIKYLWVTLQDNGVLPDTVYKPPAYIARFLDEDAFGVRLLGVGLAILMVYIVGVFVGNLIGRTMWRVLERAVMRLPLVRAIYPSVKQVTDFLLADRGAGQFQGSRVVAVQARHQGVWSIGLVTASGYGPINDAIKGNMVTVFIPSSPTALAGYVVVAHREQVVELPLKVEEALRLLISGGVLTPGVTGKPAPKAGGADVPAPGAVLLPGKTSAGNPVMVAVASPDVDPETVVSVSAGGDAPRTTAV